SVGVLGLLLLLTPTILAQDKKPDNLPDLKTISQFDGAGTDKTTAAATAKETGKSDDKSAKTADKDGKPTSSLATAKVTSAPPISTPSPTTEDQPSKPLSVFHPPDLPTIAGVGIPNVQIPDTHAALFMQKSTLPDGTVFICVGAALGAFMGAILIWRALVAWSLARSVKRAAVAQNLADMKAMTANPTKKRGLYNAVSASSTMSFDHLSGVPAGTSRPPKPFSSHGISSTPPKHPSTTSLFFSPTAGGAAAMRDPGSRSSNYLPAGYYAASSAQPLSGSPVARHHAGHSSLSLNTPGYRLSHRSGISPPASPSLPPSRGTAGYYDSRPSQSRGGDSAYNVNRNSIATLGNASSLSLNIPGGTTVPGGRAPSAYLEDLFESHGGG
ncbi:hypothetical protein GQ43DRAFT_343191, partial [Delitschia confertaspora ATCC 74209]